MARGKQKECMSLPRYAHHMSGPELLEFLGGKDKTVILRSLIFSELEQCKRSPLNGWRTLRGFWYALVKPCLSRMGGFETSDPETWNDDLSDALAGMVKLSTLKYVDLGIVDRSRPRQLAQTYTLPIMAPLEVLTPAPAFILFVEKAALYAEIEGLADYFGVSSLCGGGSPSLAACEDLTRSIGASPAYSQGTPLTLLTLTDYDPAGYKIAADVHKQFEFMARRHLGVTVRSLRLGVEPRHLEPEDLKRNAYTPSKKGLEAWFNETDGVNGQRLGLELDALPLERLRELFVNGLDAAGFPFGRMIADLERTAAKQLAWVELEAERQDLERKAEILAQGFAANWHNIAERTLTPQDLKRWAVGGQNVLYPLEHGIFGKLTLRTRNTSRVLVSGES